MRNFKTGRSMPVSGVDGSISVACPINVRSYEFRMA